MPRHVTGGVVLLVFGALAIVGLWLAGPLVDDLRQQWSSDAGATEGTVRIGVDNWVGYFPLCSPLMKGRLRERGLRLRCVDDQADLPGRMRALADGELDFAVASIDSYLLNGAGERFPGTIVAVIDESKGGDAILARSASVPDIDALKTKAELKVAFTPNSPSEHLLRAVAAHFDIPALRDEAGDWRVETNGSEQARKQLESGAVDVAVLWEPDVSRALAHDGIGKLLGTEDTEKLIVDVLLVSRDYSGDQPERVKLVLHEYFRTLKRYRDQPEALQADLEEETGLDAGQVSAMLDGVRWASLHDNATRWFGVGQAGQFTRDGVVDAIDSTVEILVDAGRLAQSPLPDQDAYRILHSGPVAFLQSQTGAGGLAPTETPTDGGARDFARLSAEEWSRLREVGTLKIRPITFQSGTGEIGAAGKSELDQAAANLSHYPNFRIVIEGHTGRRGDATANRALSKARASAVAGYLSSQHGVDPDRLRAIGRGSDEPLQKRPGESDRAWSYRLPRVELFLVAEVI